MHSIDTKPNGSVAIVNVLQKLSCLGPLVHFSPLPAAHIYVALVVVRCYKTLGCYWHMVNVRCDMADDENEIG